MKLEEVRETYSQEEDCCGRAGIDVQEIEIFTQGGGGGAYMVIKTDRWAVGDNAEIDEFADLLKATLAKFPAEEKV